MSDDDDGRHVGTPKPPTDQVLVAHLRGQVETLRLQTWGEYHETVGQDRSRAALAARAYALRDVLDLFDGVT